MAFAADQTQVMTIHSKAEARAAKGNGRIGIVSAKTGIPVAKTGLQSQKSVVPPGTSQLQSEASAGERLALSHRETGLLAHKSSMPTVTPSCELRARQMHAHFPDTVCRY